jgi:hypothetical protein
MTRDRVEIFHWKYGTGNSLEIFLEIGKGLKMFSSWKYSGENFQ